MCSPKNAVNAAGVDRRKTDSRECIMNEPIWNFKMAQQISDKTDNSTNVFGSVKGTYVIDVNQEAYLAEVEALGGGLAQGFVKAIIAEVK